MNSFNHYAFGAIGEWMYENILGIQPDNNSPGFRHFILKPLPGGTLTWAKGSFDSFCGKIEAGWTKNGNRFEYRFTIPPNTSATVYIPAKSIEKAAIIADEAEGGFRNTGYADGYAVFEIKSGTYKASSEI
jgi:alpha-L-rhamnosidase